MIARTVPVIRVRPFNEWRYDVLTSKTRKPYDRMVAVARRFLEILEENGL